MLPHVVTLASGSTDDTPGELDEVTEQSSGDNDDGSHVDFHVQQRASQHMPEAYREINAGMSSSGSANQADQRLMSWMVCKTVEGKFQFCGAEKGTVPRRSRPVAVRAGGSLHPRRELLSHTSILFGQDLLQDASVEDRHRTSLLWPGSLKVIWETCDEKAWGLQPGSLPPHVCKTPPPEIYKPCTFEEFSGQYTQFRHWVRGFLRYPYAFEFFVISGYMMRKMNLEGKPVGDPWLTPKDDIVEAGQWQQWVPPCGKSAHSKLAGKCQIVSTVHSTNMSKLYAYVMSSPISEIRAVACVCVQIHNSDFQGWKLSCLPLSASVGYCKVAGQRRLDS